MGNRVSNLDAEIWYFLCWGNSELFLLDCHVEICSCLLGLRSYFRKNTIYLIYKDKSRGHSILSIRKFCMKILSFCAILQNWDVLINLCENLKYEISRNIIRRYALNSIGA
jgi:hypothetical protein